MKPFIPELVAMGTQYTAKSMRRVKALAINDKHAHLIVTAMIKNKIEEKWLETYIEAMENYRIKFGLQDFEDFIKKL